MRYLTTKFNIKNISKEQFADIVCSLHNILNDEKEDVLVHKDYGYVIHLKSIVAYKIVQEQWIYRYIYNQDEKGLYVSIDSLAKPPIDIIDYLIRHQMIDQSEYINVDDQVHFLSKDDYASFKAFLSKTNRLPVVYIKQYHQYPSLLERTACLLKGMAHVVSGDEEFYALLKKEYHLTLHSCAFYLNNEYQKFLPREDDEDIFVNRIFMKIQNYITKRNYSYPYDMEDLYQSALNSMIDYADENENKIMNNIEYELSALQNQVKEYEDRLNKLNQQISLLENQIETNQLIIDAKEYYPVLLKGDVEEFYEGEQKDMVLYLLSDNLTNSIDKNEKRIIKKILEFNPPVGIREKYLTEIPQILLEGKLNEQSIERLRRCGIYIEKRKKHFRATFFNNPKYLLTIGSTPSDYNFGREVKRQIDLFYF